MLVTHLDILGSAACGERRTGERLGSAAFVDCQRCRRTRAHRVFASVDRELAKAWKAAA